MYKHSLLDSLSTTKLAQLKAFIAALTVSFFLISPANAGTLYFSSIFDPEISDGNIHQISTDGTGLQTVLTVGGGIRALRADQVTGKLYWTDVDAGVIRRANFDGSNIEDLISSGLTFPNALALDSSSNILYWGDQSLRQIGSATLDGGGAGQLLATPNFSKGIAVDEVNGKIYWSESNPPYGETGRIVRANLNGTVVETVLNNFGRPGDLALDMANGKIYWTDFVTNVVGRANVDGTSPENIFVVGANNNPNGIALDLIDGKVYWGQDGAMPNRGDIMRMNLDGSNPETVATGFGLISSISFVEVPDSDMDGISDDDDNCPTDFNADQADADGDGIGDVCDESGDQDNDGVSDALDQCPLTKAGMVADNTGCSIAQLCPADNTWKNHGAYVRCVRRAARDFKRSGLISRNEWRAIVLEAARSDIGKKSRKWSLGFKN